MKRASASAGSAALARGGRTALTRLFERFYLRGGVEAVRRALVAQLALSVLVAVTGALLTLLYTPSLSIADLAIVMALSCLIYVVDGALVVGPIRRGFAPVERWSEEANERTARAAWLAAADLPFVPLRRRSSYAAVTAAIVLWDVVGARRLGLSTTSFLLFIPGSYLVWLYWVALRFFTMEQLVRPLLADIGSGLPDGGGIERTRMSLARRFLVAVPAIAVFAGTIVAGVVGDHELPTLALGVAVSLVAVALIGSWLIVLLADSVAGPIGDLRVAADRVGAGDLEVRVPVVSVDETAALARSFNSMVAGLRERERIRAAFGTYVDRDVAEHILKEGTSLAGEEVEVTMMFLDVRDFTGFAERSSAPAVVAALNRLFELIVPLIHEHGGHVDKFVGDGLLAVFGAPRRQDDHADQALRAGVAIERAVREQGPDALAIGIGLNSGPVVAGNVGGAGRLEFSVIGDAVNVAARVESATRQTGDVLLLSENTERLLRGDSVALEPRPGIPLKGKRDPVMLYAPA